jgi:hypothetical protein
VVLK